MDKESGNPYYYNLVSQETQWDRPADYTPPAGKQQRQQQYAERVVPADPLSRAAGFAVTSPSPPLLFRSLRALLLAAPLPLSPADA